MKTLTVGTRKSNLALTQTQWVIDQLKLEYPDLEFQLKHIVTKGDKILDVTLSKVGGKGLFVKEIEQALLNGDIDLAVHSMKDMPSQLPEGLTIACIPVREDVRDAYISKGHIPFKDLPTGAVVGTSSLRRASQLLKVRPDITIQPIRGNIDTRLKKLEEENFDAIILAAAGLKRMGWSNSIVTEFLTTELSLPAVGQGALAIECRSDHKELIDCLLSIHDDSSSQTVKAERAFLKEMDGSCQVPIAGYAIETDEGYQLTGLVSATDGSVVLKETTTGTDPEELGKRVAHRLLENGAEALLQAARTARH